MKKIALLFLATSLTLSSCSIFSRNVNKQSSEFAINTEVVTVKDSVASKETIDKSKITIKESLSGVAISDQKSVQITGIPEVGGFLRSVDSTLSLDLLMAWNSKGELVTTATKRKESIVVQNAGSRETIMELDVISIEKDSSGLKSSKKELVSDTKSETQKKGQDKYVLTLLLISLIVIFALTRRLR